MSYLKTKISQTDDDQKYLRDDKKMYEFFLKLEKIRENEKNRKFQKWLNTNIDYNNYHYDEINDKLVGWSDSNVVRIKSIINNFILDLKTIIAENGYSINEQNKFKDEIASFLYNESR